MTDPRTIIAGILVGGKSTRMHADKALLRWGEATMLEVIVRTAGSVVGECVLLGEARRLPGGLRGLSVLPDVQPHLGPMAGLRSLLAYSPAPWNLLLGCDLPGLTPDVVRQLACQAGDDDDAVAFAVDGRVEPCCALYHARLLSSVEMALDRGRLALHELLAAARCRRIPADPATCSALVNVNTPQAYRDAMGA